MGWQPLFIVAAVGAGIIAIGVGLFVLQLIVSYIQRKDNIDYTGDPWNGRTLEWSIPSPAPFYNFAIDPVVNDQRSILGVQATSQRWRIKDPSLQMNYDAKKYCHSPNYWCF